MKAEAEVFGLNNKDGYSCNGGLYVIVLLHSHSVLKYIKIVF